MNDREGFISRWARRKRAAAKGEERARERADVPATEAADDPRIDGKAESKFRGEAAASEAGPGEPAIDLSKLPSIESITAETDIRPFLARGVPSALRNAALRKMWVADPSIRDFIEVAENQWDFNAPGEILGFDLSPPTGDVKRMVAEILGDQASGDSEPHRVAATEGTAGEPIVAAQHGNDGAAPQQGVVSDQGSIRQTIVAQEHIVDSASQKDIATQQPEHATIPKRRSNGGAMPS